MQDKIKEANEIKIIKQQHRKYKLALKEIIDACNGALSKEARDKCYKIAREVLK